MDGECCRIISERFIEMSDKTWCFKSLAMRSRPSLNERANIMKTLKCDLCEVTAEGETFEAWMEALKPHYIEAHADVMNDPSKTKEDMEKWM